MIREIMEDVVEWVGGDEELGVVLGVNVEGREEVERGIVVEIELGGGRNGEGRGGMKGDGGIKE